MTTPQKYRRPASPSRPRERNGQRSTQRFVTHFNGIATLIRTRAKQRAAPNTELTPVTKVIA